jgi:hypothetical protein
MRWLTTFIAVISVCVGVTALILHKKEVMIESTRFGIVDCTNIKTMELCVVKDETTKKQYLLCFKCELTEYKGKK